MTPPDESNGSRPIYDRALICGGVIALAFGGGETAFTGHIDVIAYVAGGVAVVVGNYGLRKG